MCMVSGFILVNFQQKKDRMRYAKQCLNTIMNQPITEYEKLIYPLSKKLLKEHGQYKYFLSGFGVKRSFNSGFKDSEWKITITAINEYEPIDPMDPDVNGYASIEMPKPDFLMTFTAKKQTTSWEFTLYGKHSKGKNYLVVPIIVLSK